MNRPKEALNDLYSTGFILNGCREQVIRSFHQQVFFDALHTESWG